MSVQPTTVRMTGLFSGIDTDALVRASTMREQARIDELRSRHQQTEWRRDQLIEINNSLRVFRDKYASTLGASNLMSRGAFSRVNAIMEPNSGITVQAAATAAEGFRNVRVDQIATAASMEGHRLSGRPTGLTDAEISGEIRNLTSIPGGAFLSNLDFTINGVNFTFAANASLQDIIDEVNSSDAGVTMSYTQAEDRITIRSNRTGAPDWNLANAQETLVVEDHFGFLAHFGMHTVEPGQNAVIFMNNSEEPIIANENTITLDGVTMTFHRPTGNDGVDFTLESENGFAAERVRSMIDSFNELFESLSAALNERPDRNFRPLTEEQRLSLSDREIVAWEERAQQGLLHRHRTLDRLVNGLRGSLTSVFADDGVLSSVGISSSGFVQNTPSQLVFDEERFLEALSEDPDRIHRMFAAPATDDFGGGLMVRFGRLMDEFVNTVSGQDLQNVNNQLHNYSRSITEQENRLHERAERLYLQYANLETALGQMMAQQESMAMMFGWGHAQNQR